MKIKCIFFVFLISVNISYSQSLSVFDVDASAFPNLKAKVFSFDKGGNQIQDLSKFNLILTEDGEIKADVKLKCYPPKPILSLSTILTIDMSGSMCGRSLDIAKAAATAWIKLLPLGKSECAITAFRSDNYYITDFTQDRTVLLKSVDNLQCDGGTEFDAAFLNRSAGALRVVDDGKYKKVVVLFTDGFADGNKDEIIKKAKASNTTIYCVTVDNPTPEILKEIAEKTGGQYFDNVSTPSQAEDIYRSILMMAQGGDPCEIEWTSKGCKPDRKASLKVSQPSEGLKPSEGCVSDFNYTIPYEKLPQIKYSPASSVKFKIKEPGKVYTEKISITAQVEPLNITAIKMSNTLKVLDISNDIFRISDYGGSAPPFTLNPDETRNLTIEFNPVDSSYAYARFEIESEACYGKYFYASGGDPKKKAVNQTIKLTFPNGDEELIAGSDTTITWEGVSPSNNVKLEYTIDEGKTWKSITDKASGLAYKWRVPVPYPSEGSDKVLVRVTAKGYDVYSGCEKDVEICGKIWMGCNLDVETYRNGDLIPEVQDSTEWANLTTGAWCYYNNDPVNGLIYGKLYNWYAVNDTSGLAPEGYHIPTDAEWTELVNCLGGERIAGGKLKSIGTIENGDDLWHSLNKGASNESGFSAFPGGYRYFVGYFDHLSDYGVWWSATEDFDEFAWSRYLFSMLTSIYRDFNKKGMGFSVRCVRD